MVKIMKDGKEIDIEMRNPKGRHLKEYFKAGAEASKKGNLLIFTEMTDKITLELQDTFKTIEELDELDISEKNKLVKSWEDMLTGKEESGFLPNSSKLPKP